MGVNLFRKIDPRANVVSCGLLMNGRSRRHRATLTTDLFGEWIIVIEHTRPGGALRPILTLTADDPYLVVLLVA